MSPVHEAAVGATVEWYTPPELFEAIGLEFDLDPASPGADVVPWVPAREHYTKADNGLDGSWVGDRVWLNPPYGPAGVAFVNRMLTHNNGMLLLPARTETNVFQRADTSASETCFLRERLHFIREDGYQARASFGSVLFAFGWECADRLRHTNIGVCGYLTDGGGTGARRRVLRRAA